MADDSDPKFEKNFDIGAYGQKLTKKEQEAKRIYAIALRATNTLPRTLTETDFLAVMGVMFKINASAGMVLDDFSEPEKEAYQRRRR